jgi:hypothetical protein
MKDSTPPRPASDWRQALEAAQRENDPRELRPLVTIAEDAIFARLQELNGKSTIENEEITRAVAVVRELQVTKLGFPRWSGEDLHLLPTAMGTKKED